MLFIIDCFQVLHFPTVCTECVMAASFEPWIAETCHAEDSNKEIRAKLRSSDLVSKQIFRVTYTFVGIICVWLLAGICLHCYIATGKSQQEQKYSIDRQMGLRKMEVKILCIIYSDIVTFFEIHASVYLSEHKVIVHAPLYVLLVNWWLGWLVCVNKCYLWSKQNSVGFPPHHQLLKMG